MVCQFKGREMDFKDLAFKLFERFADDIAEVSSLNFLELSSIHPMES